MPETKFYYTFTVGFVRFLAIHTEAFLTETSMLDSMMKFISQVLDRSLTDKANYPWLVAYGHRPMYCSSIAKATACGKEANIMKSYLEPLFHKFNVDLYVNGHVHNYQRTSPVYQGISVNSFDSSSSIYINPSATLYVTTGGPGSDGSNSKVDYAGASD